MNALEHYSKHICVAEVKLDLAGVHLSGAQHQRDQTARQMAALEGKKESIIARRSTGDHRPDDGADLHLIAADIEGLRPLLDDAEAVLQHARARQVAANAELAAAGQTYAIEEARTTIEALDDHADRLVSLLQETLRQRHAAAAALPLSDREYRRVAGRLKSFDAVVVDDVKVLRQAGQSQAIPYNAKPVGKPSDNLYNEVWRLHYSNGRFN